MASTSIAGKQHFPEESRFKEMFTCNLQEKLLLRYRDSKNVYMDQLMVAHIDICE